MVAMAPNGVNVTQFVAVIILQRVGCHHRAGGSITHLSPYARIEEHSTCMEMKIFEIVTLTARI